MNTYLIPSGKALLLPYTSQDVQRANMVAVFVMVFVCMGEFVVVLRSVLDISATGLNPYLRHDIRIGNL